MAIVRASVYGEKAGFAPLFNIKVTTSNRYIDALGRPTHWIVPANQLLLIDIDTHRAKFAIAKVAHMNKGCVPIPIQLLQRV